MKQLDHPRIIETRRQREFVAALTIVVGTLTLRTWGISSRFLLLGDQIRDWDIALRPLSELPLVGPATHVHGYTIGPAFYWILWGIRVTFGPWFENLPHAGGIGQAVLASLADGVLLVAVERRTGSVWIALAAVILLATAPFDLSLSAIVWNPTMGTTLAKITTALILLNWQKQSTVQAVIAVAISWMAIQAYTGAVYVTVAALAVTLFDPILTGDRRTAIRNAVIVAAVLFALQLPYLAYRWSHPSEPAMAAVTGSVGDVLSGRANLRVSESLAGYLKAVNGIELEPWHLPFTGWLLLGSGAIVAFRYRRDFPLLAMILVPQILAVAGYAFFLSGLDNYYYLSLMPAAVMTVVLAVTAFPMPLVARGMAILFTTIAVVLVPTRRSYAMTMNQMPEYGAIVHASRIIVGRATPVRSIQTEFRLPPTNDPEFVYRILGGAIDRNSSWIAIIQRNGGVSYRKVGPA